MKGSWRGAFAEILSQYSEPGVALKGLRTREGLTKSQLAEKLGTNHANISNMESGKSPIEEDTAKKLSTLFDIDYRVFLS